MKSIGRPQKYGSEMLALNLTVPKLYRDSIIEEAHMCSVSVNEYMNGLIASADKELAKQLVESMKAMREELDSKTRILNETSKGLVAFKSMSGNALEFLTSKIESDPELDSLIKQALSRNQRMFQGLLANSGAKEAIDKTTEVVYAEVEMMLLKSGRTIRRPTLIKTLIKKNMVLQDN